MVQRVHCVFGVSFLSLENLNHETRKTHETILKRVRVIRVSPRLNILTNDADNYGTNAFGIGLSPVAPNCRINVPAVSVNEYHVAADGLNTVASIFPSPS